MTGTDVDLFKLLALAFQLGGVWTWFIIASTLYLSGRTPPKAPGASRRKRRTSSKT